MSAAACKKVLCCTVNQNASAATGTILDDFFEPGGLFEDADDDPKLRAELDKVLAEVDKATNAHVRAQKKMLALL